MLGTRVSEATTLPIRNDNITRPTGIDVGSRITQRTPDLTNLDPAEPATQT